MTFNESDQGIAGAEEDSADGTPLDILLDNRPVQFKLAFFGAPSVGKSTMINCLLGQSLVYTSIKESTGCPTEILARPTDGSIPDDAVAEVVFVDDTDLEDMLAPIERTADNAVSEIEFLTTTPLEELNMDESERTGRIAKLTSVKELFKTRKEQYAALVKQYKTTKRCVYTTLLGQIVVRSFVPGSQSFFFLCSAASS